MDTAQWSQEIGLVKPMEEMVPRPMPSSERRAPRPQKEQALNCPRCNSTNTKFCYYNNYSLTQPRYFCKTCRRYWTEGGSLRNVPVGGGSRKNKRSSNPSTSSSAITSLSSSPTPSSKKLLHDLTPPTCSQSSSQNLKMVQGHDLNLAFSTSQDYHTISDFVELPNMNENNKNSSSSTPSSLSALELLRTGITSRGMNMSSFMPMPAIDTNTVYSSSGYALQDFKPTINFGIDGLGGGGAYGGVQGVPGNAAGRIWFPFDDLKLVPGASDQDFEQNRAQGNSTGNWSGMLGGGSSW